MTRIFCTFLAWLCLPALGIAQSFAHGQPQRRTAHSSGADWHLKGEGVVCCPCAVPCPCRTNADATYGHCEATLYLHIKEGHYGNVSLNDLHVVDTGGMCSVNYEKLSAIYFDRSTSPEVQEAFLQLLASFSATQTEEFPCVRTVSLHGQELEGHLIEVSIPGILEMALDRNWGQASPPLGTYAAQDHFANALQYVQNIRYWMHDDEAKVHFDYSRRQANYRSIDLDADDYRSRRMIVQYLDGSGWFNAKMLQIINDEHLTLPDLDAIRREVARLQGMHRGTP